MTFHHFRNPQAPHMFSTGMPPETGRSLPGNILKAKGASFDPFLSISEGYLQRFLKNLIFLPGHGRSGGHPKDAI